MAVSEPSNTLARPQSGAPALSPDVQQLTKGLPAVAPIDEPTPFDYIGIVILFGAIWAICAGAAFWVVRA